MEHRPLSLIASEIYTHWPTLNYAAKPYVRAMCALRTMDDKYGADDAKTIVLYFLSNAGSWRGEHARRIKAELKKIAGIK